MKVKHLLFFFALMAAASQLQAQATLSVQGTIQRSFGGAVDDGKYALTFKLYTAETGGTPVWSETQDNIEVIGGVYSALLGEANPLTAGFNEVYYLGIAVDGGAELIPRTRLTSAPYALSLIGQSNTFPSAGNVGVGTVSPEARLHVSNPDGSVQQIISTSNDNTANLVLKAGDHEGYLDVNQYAYTMGSANKSINIVPANSAGRVHLYGNGSLKAHTDEDGFVSKGRIFIASKAGSNEARLSFNSSEGANGEVYADGGAFTFQSVNKSLNLVPGPNGSVHLFGGVNSVKANTDNDGFVVHGRIHVNGVGFSYGWLLHSDMRTKKDLSLSPGSADLKTLMSLKVTDYRYVDPNVRGGELVKGFIAQEVEQSYPEAVSKAAGFLPSIMSNAVSVSGQGDAVTIALDKAHGLAVGDRVRVVCSGGTFKDVQVTSIPDNRSFTAGGLGNDLQKGEVMVYGKEVSDFRSVDYNSIFILNVSATQELARRVAELEAANAGLMEKNNKLQQQNEGLRGDVNGLSDRLTKLENLLMSNGKR
jgi:hypothetical protein